ncbi:PilZ domain-containing protein [Humidesulfovibrio idahonensis]
MTDAAWWTGMALVAAFSAAGGFALGRAGRRSVVPAQDAPLAATAPFLKDLAARAVPLDFSLSSSCSANGNGGAGNGAEAAGESLGRCVPISLGPDGLLCELLDIAAPGRAGPGARVTCFFPPQRLEGRKVNAFETVIAAVDAVAEPPRMLLAAPTELLAIVRRRHTRKRVSDQRFVRVRLWLAEAGVSPVYFPDAAPDIWVNAYDGRHGEENAVTDISAGGLALEVRAGLLPGALEQGSPVVLKCSLFQFREKQFKPYWYAGLVRGVSAPGGPQGKLRRIAVGFTHVGAADEAAPQGVDWTARVTTET